jgi:hypothetical protein
MQNRTNERQAAAREGLRTALVTLAKVARTQERFHDAASASASGTKGSEGGGPTSGRDPSEFRERACSSRSVGPLGGWPLSMRDTLERSKPK